MTSTLLSLTATLVLLAPAPRGTQVASAAATTVQAGAATSGGHTATSDDQEFHWREKPGESLDLYFGDRLVLRYMNAAHDNSSKARHEMTFKVFHHVLDPKTGTTLLTNG